MIGGRLRRRSPALGPWLLALSLLACAFPLRAQTSPWDYRGLEMTRAGLEELLQRYDAVVSSSAYGERLKADAAATAALIRERLEQGDFRPGDRIVIEIAGEQQTTDTLTVEANREVALRGMGRVRLEGVLRSELEQHMTTAVGRYVKTPSVKTVSLIRLSMQGLIARPGFYVFPATALLQDVIMQSGGPTPSADLSKVRIERNGTVLMSSEEVRTALTEGRSVDQMNLRAGDQITIPSAPLRGSSAWWKTAGRYALIIGLPLLLGVRASF